MKRIIIYLITVFCFNINVGAEDEMSTDVFEEFAQFDDEPCRTSNISIETEKNTAVNGQLSVTCNDLYKIEITKNTKYGSLEFSNENNSFIYIPFENQTGHDSFSYRISTDDILSNISECSIKISDEVEDKNGFYEFTYADMKDNPMKNAAVKMAELDVIRGERIGREYYFYPGMSVTRGMAINCINTAIGINNKGSSDIGVFFADEKTFSPQTKRNAYISYNAGIVKGRQQDGKCYLCPNEAITKAELISMLDRAMSLPSQEDISLGYSDTKEIPSYAIKSVQNLAALGMLSDMDSELLNPNKIVTKAEFAALLYKAVKYNEESTIKTISQRIKDGFYGKIIT